MEQLQKHRPLGVTIIAILTIIGGMAFLVSGITATTVAPFLSGVSMNNNTVFPAAGISVTIPPTLLVAISAATGVAFLTLGIAYFIMAYGLLKGRGFVPIVTDHVGTIFTIIIIHSILYL